MGLISMDFSIVQRLLCSERPDVSFWLSLLCTDCALRVGAARTLFGAEAVRAELGRFLGSLLQVGCAGCEIVGTADHWFAETDVVFKGARDVPPEPCVIVLRTANGRLKDVRFYLVLQH